MRGDRGRRPLGTGGTGHGQDCTLTLTDTIDELGKAARDAAGWHVFLDRLEAALDGAPTDSRWAPLNERYAQEFGPEASTIGPPSGHPAAR